VKQLLKLLVWVPACCQLLTAWPGHVMLFTKFLLELAPKLSAINVHTCLRATVSVARDSSALTANCPSGERVSAGLDLITQTCS
jgi:hypothetical protein